MAFIGLEALGRQKAFQLVSSFCRPGNFSAYAYIVGALVALLIVGLANAPLPVPGAMVERPIRFLAGATFGLYLLHFPFSCSSGP